VPYCSLLAKKRLHKFASPSPSTGELGCWIIAHQPVGQLNKPETFLHLDVYATRTEAEAAKSAGSVVVESLGKMWLLTIADKGWRPPGGERIAEIGPLPITAGQTYSAQYMEAIFSSFFTIHQCTRLHQSAIGSPKVCARLNIGSCFALNRVLQEREARRVTSGL
jgi:hypothetical protein